MPTPNEVKLAVVGCGYWGRNLVRNFARLGALGVVADTVPGRADEAAQKYNVPALAYTEALADPSISAVVLATPAEQHAEMALKALAAGKHVFVEKPLALAVGDGERVLRAARAADRQVMVGHLLQYHPAFLKLLELTQAGELGRLQYIYSNRLNLGRIRREENVFWSFAPHDISMILALAGEAPTRVRGIGSSYLHQQIADVTATHLAFASGINAHIFVSWLHPFKEQKLVVIGDRGMAVFNDGEDWERKLTLFRHHIDWRNGLPQPARAEAELVPLSPAEPLEVECVHFIDCIANDRTPRTDANEGLAVLRVLAAAAPAALPAAATSSAGTLGEGVFAHSSACIDENCTIGDGTRIWHFSHILSGSHIGRNCMIGQNVMIGPGVSIGEGCKVQNNVSIYKGVVLEDAVFCGPSCVFTNVMNPRADVERKSEFRPTHVGRGATIGANATIVCGHTLGQYSLVGAGAVVTRDVPAFAVVAGNPARRIGWVSRAGERLGPDLVCPRTGQRYYQLGDDFLVEAEARKGEPAMLDG